MTFVLFYINPSFFVSPPSYLTRDLSPLRSLSLHLILTSARHYPYQLGPS
jgi:hypothetical protein